MRIDFNNKCIRKNGVYLLLDHEYINVVSLGDNIIARIPVEEILNTDSFDVISKYYFESKNSFIKKIVLLVAKKKGNCCLKTNSLDCLQVSIGKACNYNCIMCYAAEQHKHTMIN